MKRRTNFRQMLEKQWACGNFVCVGLDSDFDKIPATVKKEATEILRDSGILSGEWAIIEQTLLLFNRRIIDSTKDIVCAYKPNIAFYGGYGRSGLSALERTIGYIRAVAPEAPVILDAKYADIGNTNKGYVRAAFGIYGADAVTVHPYLGQEAMQPFLDQKDKGIIILCRTSNPGAGEFQNLPIGRDSLCNIVARQVAEHWNENGNCAVVVGATYPEDLREIRKIVGDMPILIPGIGSQGGDIEKTVTAGMDSRGQGIIINSSRGVIFASSGPDFAQAARDEVIKLNELINQYRNG